GEGAAGTAIFLRDRGTQETCRACLGPDVAIVDAAFAPALQVGRVLGRDETPSLLFEQHNVLGHPAGRRQIENAHERNSGSGMCSNCHTGRSLPTPLVTAGGLNPLFTSNGKNSPPRTQDRIAFHCLLMSPGSPGPSGSCFPLCVGCGHEIWF